MSECLQNACTFGTRHPGGTDRQTDRWTDRRTRTRSLPALLERSRLLRGWVALPWGAARSISDGSGTRQTLKVQMLPVIAPVDFFFVYFLGFYCWGVQGWGERI